METLHPAAAEAVLDADTPSDASSEEPVQRQLETSGCKTAKKKFDFHDTKSSFVSSRLA